MIKVYYEGIILKVKELIKKLADFNPECEIIDPIDFGWYTGYESSDIEHTKLDAKKLSICSCKKKYEKEHGELTCKYCGKKFNYQDEPNFLSTTYCSNKCQQNDLF